MGEKTDREKNIEFFNEHLESWLKEVAYKHKYVVIEGQEIKSVFDDFSNALKYATTNFDHESFIIQHIIGNNEQVGFLRLAI